MCMGINYRDTFEYHAINPETITGLDSSGRIVKIFIQGS